MGDERARFLGRGARGGGSDGLKRLRDEGKITGGMLPKVAAIERALAGGVARVHVISYAQPDSLLLEVFTNEGTGTLVVNDKGDLRPEEQTS